MKIKIDKNIFAYTGLFFMTLYYLLSDTVLFFSSAEIFLLISVLFFILQFLLTTKHYLKTLILIVAILCIFVLQYTLGHDSRILMYIISVIGLQQVPFRKTMKIILYTKMILSGCVIVITTLGIQMIPKTSEYVLGFKHGNLFMLTILEMFLLYICLNWKSMYLRSNLVVGSLVVISFFVSKSRTGFLLFTLSFVLYLQIKYSKVNKLKYLCAVTAVTPVVMYALSIGLPFLMNQGIFQHYPQLNSLIQRMNLLLSNRLTLSAIQLKNTDFHLLSTTTNEIKMSMYKYTIVDSGYVQLLLVFGISGSMLFLLFYTGLICKIGKLDWMGKEKYIYLLSILAMSLYAFTENSLCSLKYNFTLLFVLLLLQDSSLITLKKKFQQIIIQLNV